MEVLEQLHGMETKKIQKKTTKTESDIPIPKLFSLNPVITEEVLQVLAFFFFRGRVEGLGMRLTRATLLKRGVWAHQFHVRVPGLAGSVLGDYDELHSGIGGVAIAGYNQSGD